jgi:hypothetical protein
MLNPSVRPMSACGSRSTASERPGWADVVEKSRRQYVRRHPRRLLGERSSPINGPSPLPERVSGACSGWIQALLDGMVPTVRFCRPRAPSPSSLLPHRPVPLRGPARLTAAKPGNGHVEAGRTGPEAGRRDAVATEAERRLHQSHALDRSRSAARIGLSGPAWTSARHWMLSTLRPSRRPTRPTSEAAQARCIPHSWPSLRPRAGASARAPPSTGPSSSSGPSLRWRNRS